MSTDDQVSFLAKNVRVDHALIADMIRPGSRVLDIGSGDGTLIHHLVRAKGCDARGIEIDMNQVMEAISLGLAVMHGDADTDLQHYPDGAFDYVVLSRTLQAVEKPHEVLRQMLRIGGRAIVSFPNFGHWLVRWQLLRSGRMPMTPTWDKPWHETPNIHLCTIEDFVELCDDLQIVIEQGMVLDWRGRPRSLRAPGFLANLLGEQGLFLLRRR